MRAPPRRRCSALAPCQRLCGIRSDRRTPGGVNVLIMTSFRQPGPCSPIAPSPFRLITLSPDGEHIEVFAPGSRCRGRQVVPTCPGWCSCRAAPDSARRGRSAGRPGWTGRCGTSGCCCSTSAVPARSTPANRQTLARLGDAKAQADYLAHFRADSIVADAELIRPQVTGGAPWAVLGQSFGGFCTVSYLSMAPGGLQRGVHHRRPARPDGHRG